jgi:hypothetical protein
MVTCAIIQILLEVQKLFACRSVTVWSIFLLLCVNWEF